MAPSAPAGADAPCPSSASFSRGPLETLTPLHARHDVLTSTGPLDYAETPLPAATGRVLAQDLRAPADFPPANLSAVDGYAIADAAAPTVGTRYRVIGEAAAGRPFSGAVGPGECVRIFTGAWLPAGAQRVLMQEHVATTEAQSVTVQRPDSAPRVRTRAENHCAGDVLVRAGSVVGPLEIALAASVGVAALPVHRVPRVAHLVTGSELVRAGAPVAAGQVHDANSPLIAALTTRAGAELVAQALLPDDLAQLEDAARRLPPHEVLILSGGAGHGRYDLACPLLERLGFTLHFRSVAMRPGKPLAFATAQGRLAFALPGNPVSHWATWQLLVAPALRRLAGEAVAAEPSRLVGELTADWTVEAEERAVFWPAHAAPHGASWRVTPLRFLNSGDLAGVLGANALLCAAPHCPLRRAAGDPAEFIFCP